MFEIEKNVPIPDGYTKKMKYPFKEMEVGDSIFFTESVMKSARSYSHSFGLRYGVKFTTRLVHGGMRIWRVA
ncbi:MAG: hypothetical protein ACRDBQ_22135 [Shewanella sp.]